MSKIFGIIALVWILWGIWSIHVKIQEVVSWRSKVETSTIYVPPEGFQFTGVDYYKGVIDIALVGYNSNWGKGEYVVVVYIKNPGSEKYSVLKDLRSSPIELWEPGFDQNGPSVQMSYSLPNLVLIHLLARGEIVYTLLVEELDGRTPVVTQVFSNHPKD